MPFLESCGFKCPEHKDRASFMQEVTSVVGQLEFATDDLRSAKDISTAERTTRILERHLPPRYRRTTVSLPTGSAQQAVNIPRCCWLRSCVHEEGRLCRVSVAQLRDQPVCDRQLKLAIAQGPMNRARTIQVLPMLSELLAAESRSQC